MTRQLFWPVSCIVHHRCGVIVLSRATSKYNSVLVSLPNKPRDIPPFRYTFTLWSLCCTVGQARFRYICSSSSPKCTLATINDPDSCSQCGGELAAWPSVLIYSSAWSNIDSSDCRGCCNVCPWTEPDRKPGVDVTFHEVMRRNAAGRLTERESLNIDMIWKFSPPNCPHFPLSSRSEWKAMS